MNIRRWGVVGLAVALAVALALLGSCKKTPTPMEDLEPAGAGGLTNLDRLELQATAAATAQPIFKINNTSAGAESMVIEDAGTRVWVVGNDGSQTGNTSLSGAWKVVGPTAATTATPVARINNAADVNDLLVVEKDASPVFIIGNAGAITSKGITATGDLSLTGNQSITGAWKAVGPTAATTATPVARIDNAADVNDLLVVEKDATPVVIVYNSGNMLVANDLEVDDTLNVDGDIDLDGDGFDVDITAGFSIDGDAASNVSVAGAGIDLTLASAAGRIVIQASEATADAVHIDANGDAASGLDIDVGATNGMSVDGGCLNIGGGSPASCGDNDAYVTGDFEVDGTLDLDGAVDMDGSAVDIDLTAGFSIDGDAGSNVSVAGAGIDLTLASAAGRIVIQASEATADAVHIDADGDAGAGLDIDVGATNGMSIDGGCLNIGGGSPASCGDNDAYVTGDFEVDGTIDADGPIASALNTANFMLPSVLSTTVVYSTASGTVATVPDGQVWFIHYVYANVTANWNTGETNDATLQIGDGGDPNGLLDLADAELQTTDTEGTGAVQGWQGFFSTDTVGAYLAQGLGFVYAPSGAAETIDYAVGGTALDAGSADIYIVYTRIK